MKFPIRLGEYKQLNDGLVGYWVGDDEAYKNDVMYAPMSDEGNDPAIVTRDTAMSGSKFTLCQSLEQNPQTLCILMDPRGMVHASTGILPTKAISIPPDQYSKALQNISITFLTAPVISNISLAQPNLEKAIPTKDQATLPNAQLPDHLKNLKISLPAEAGYRWSWISKTENGWKEIEDLLSKEDQSQPTTQADLHSRHIIVEGWLRLKQEPKQNNELNKNN